MAEQFRKKKKYGQNFLNNPAVPERIVKESGVDENCGVLEIGPGLGALTLKLAPAVKKVVAVEIDHELIAPLTEKFSAYPNIELIEQDIMKTDLDELIRTRFPGMPVCVCANLPYYITTPILMKLLESKCGFRSITVMVQKEVANRLVSAYGTEDYGAITASIQYYASVRKLFLVTAGNFSPPPKVDSAVIRLDLYDSPPVKVQDEKLFFEIIKAAFLQRRKTLCNALCSYFPSLSKTDCAEILAECGLKADVRGEDLPIQAFAAIADSICKKKIK